MLYCVNCSLNLAGLEVETVGICPLCESPVREIKAQKLINVLQELNQAVQELNSDKLRNNPKNVIMISSVIEKGEGKLKRELHRRIMNLKDIEYEILVIKKFADFLGYSLADVEKTVPTTIDNELTDNELEGLDQNDDN